MDAKKMYHAGIYLRLSRDDAAQGGGMGTWGSRSESNSISSQRELCRAYIRDMQDMQLYDIYVDDGYSGANFDRPEFKRLMEDVRAGKVDCIVVKDLSRFGRDYIEAGRLLQKIFPALHVRFIAVTDNFDSFTADFNETSLVLPIKNFVNDSYCRDISGKVKSHQRVKREKGEFIGAFAVYGYRKDEKDRNRLVPDGYAAQIVRNIFDWRLKGMSSLAIAGRLNETGVLSPMEYKRSKGENFSTGFALHGSASWSSVAVKRILTNEIYTGTMVQGKSEKINYKINEYREKPKEEWVRVADTHKALISKKDFDTVQRLMDSPGRACGGQRKAHLFSGMLFCGDCGEPMVRRINRYKGNARVCFICSTRNRGMGCTRHSISEEEMAAAILLGMRAKLRLLLDEETVLSRTGGMEVGFEELAEFDKEILRLRGEEEKYLKLRSGLYEDLKSGVITQEDFYSFRSIYEERYVKVQEAVGRQEEMLRRLFRSGIAGTIRLERFKEALEITELSRDVLLCFVERILVYEGMRVCIELRSKEQFTGALMLSEYAVIGQREKQRTFGTDIGGRKNCRNLGEGMGKDKNR